MNMPKFPVYSLKILLVAALPAILAAAACLAAVQALTDTAGSASALAGVAFGRGEVASRLERQTLLTAHHLRGYALTGERHFLDEAKKELALAVTRLQELKTAAARAAGTGFTEEAERVSWLVDAYKKAAEAVVAQDEAVSEARTAFAAAGHRLVELADALAEREKAALVALAVKYPPGTQVRAVSDRIFHAQDLAAAGRELLTAEAEAGRARRPEILRAAVGRMEGMEVHIEALRRQAVEAEARDVEALAAASGDLSKAAGQLAGQWEILHASGRALAVAERDALDAVSKAVVSANAVERGGLEAFAADLAVKKSLLWTLLGITVAFGLVWTILAVRWLGVPVTRCAAFALELARGRFPRGLSVSGRDEVGILAESLREVSRRFGRNFAR